MTSFIQINQNIDDITVLDIPINVISIVLNNNNISSIPKNFFKQFKNLENIELAHNKISVLDFIIGSKVSSLDLSYNLLDKNSIKEIPYYLSFIDVTGNIYHNFQDLQPIYTITYGNVTLTNEKSISNIITKKYNKFKSNMPQVLPDIDNNNDDFNYINDFNRLNHQYRINDNDDTDEDDNVTDNYNDNVVANVIDQNILTNNQNVHYTKIQENVRKTITYIISKKKKQNYIEILEKIYRKYNRTFFYFMNNNFNKLLNTYNECTSEIVYSYSGHGKVCTISDLLNGICTIINDTTDEKIQSSMITSLYLQMVDGVSQCFVGKYTRIVNSLSSFDNNINIVNSTISEQMSNKISQLIAQKLDKEQILEIIIPFMKKLSLSKEDQKIWLDSIEDFF